jgi:hypothetical protein
MLQLQKALKIMTEGKIPHINAKVKSYAVKLLTAEISGG